MALVRERGKIYLQFPVRFHYFNAYNDLLISRPANSPAVFDEIKAIEPLQKELLLILKEIRVITDKVGLMVLL